MTQMRVPKFSEVEPCSDQKKGAYIESAPCAVLSMIPVMGCENHIVLAIAEISELSNWKEMQMRTGGRESIPLVSTGDMGYSSSMDLSTYRRPPVTTSPSYLTTSRSPLKNSKHAPSLTMNNPPPYADAIHTGVLVIYEIGVIV